ncbi:MAG: hypothetical protein ABSF63_07855 [Candidatus Bathyarchaeia archaeon]
MSKVRDLVTAEDVLTIQQLPTVTLMVKGESNNSISGETYDVHPPVLSKFGLSHSYALVLGYGRE